MRKWVCALCLFLCACGDKPTLQGQEFHLFQNGLEITLGFGAHDNRYYGKMINSYYGTYQIVGEKIAFSVPSSTMYGADLDDLKAEEKFFDTLSHIQTYHLTETTLTLMTADNNRLIFQKNEAQ